MATEENCYLKYRFEYPKEKPSISKKLQASYSFHKLSTFNTTSDELFFVMDYENQKRMNVLGQSYIRDIIWLETEEVIGIVGLLVQRHKRTANLHILLVEPFSTGQLCSFILLEYISIARCLLLDKIIVNLPQGEAGISLLLEKNGFSSHQHLCGTITYTIDFRSSEQTILCRGCGMNFTFSKEEQSIYLKKGFASPKRCPKCRLIKKIALQNLHQDASKNIDDPKYNEALHNTCYSWRYRGYCRYSSECRYIHEDLSSISVLYDLDSPRILTDTISSHKPASDTTESAISALSAEHIQVNSSQNMYFRQPGESWPTYPEYLPWYGYAAASPYQVMAPIIIPFPYPGAYSQVPMNTVSYPDSGLNDRSRSFASDDASTPFTRSNRSR